MAYHEEETTKLRRLSSKQAIALAMEGRWREAVTVNQGLIESFPSDVDAYNRLGRAYMELGEYALSRDAYDKAIKVDPYNTIAQKNLSRLSRLGEGEVKTDAEQAKVEPHQFIEEVAKAGIVNLRRLAPPEVLAKTVTGAKVELKVDGPHLNVENARGEYLGQVEPRHSQRLVKMMAGGNRYAASVVSAAENMVTVIIREVYQDPSLAGQPSFPPRGPEHQRADIDDRIGDRMIRRTLEHLEDDEATRRDTGYAIVDGEEAEVEILSEDDYEDEENEA